MEMATKQAEFTHVSRAAVNDFSSTDSAFIGKP